MGVDFSARFVAVAQAIQQGKGVDYGSKTANLPILNGIDPSRASFQQVSGKVKRCTLLYGTFSDTVCMDTE